MVSVDEFKRWHEEHADSNPADPAKKIYDALLRAVSENESVRCSVARCLVPVKAKSGWQPGFLPEVDEIGERYAAGVATISRIEDDIAAFGEVTEGPCLMPLLNEAGRLRGSIERAATAAGVARRKAEDPRRGLTLAEIAQEPGVKAAEAALDAARKEAEPKIAKLQERIEAARTIIRKYDL